VTGGRSGFALAPPRTPRSLRGSVIRLPLRSQQAYTSPCATIAFATFTKPAMLAPTT
jgi:hypothetical protein